MEKKTNKTLYVLAAIVVIGFFIIMGMLMKYPLPDGSSEAVHIMFGNLGAGFMVVVGYFFGSSKSSSDKTELLNGK